MSEDSSHAVEVGEPAAQGETRARRHPSAVSDLVQQPAEDIRTVYDLLQSSVRRMTDCNAMAWREIVDVHEEKKEVVKVVQGQEVKEEKSWKYFQLSEPKWWTFKDLANEVDQVGNGLAALGLGKETVFNIYSATKPEWQAIAHGCISRSIPFATSYETLGEEGLQHSISEPEAVGIFTNAALLPMLSKIISDTPSLKHIIYDGDAKSEAETAALETIASTRNDIQVLKLEELRRLGREKVSDPRPPKPEDVLTIMYTSGSTGKPKGVVLTHANIVASVGGIHIVMEEGITSDDVYLAYLPLAHVLEFIVECFGLFKGIPLCYGSPKTLTSASVRNCPGDLETYKPTILVGVPAVFETIAKGIRSKVKAGGSVAETVFDLACWVKKRVPIVGPLLADSIVFNKVKSATGGRLKFTLAGGAPISVDTQEFLTTVLAPVLQGYGMTESCGMCAILPPSHPRTAVVGVPVPSVEIKLVDVSEAGYLASNDPPQGEVLIRGPSVCDGYYKRDDITKETFTEDGWLQTGDIGQWNADGTLSIIDRKKNLVKLSGGEYIALRLESIYKSAPIVSNICLYAESTANNPMAIVYAQEKDLRKIAGDESADFKSLSHNDKVKDEVLKQLNATGKKAGLKSMELLKTVVLSPEEWTPQNGLLTAAQKLQRKKIFETVEEDVKKVYP